MVIATMHGKEQVLAPVMEQHLGVRCEVVEIDSDAFGTFSGEVERTGTPVEAALQKCYAAFEKTDATLALASEGSFGPHPVIGLVPGNEEWLVLLERQTNRHIVARHITTETNFAGQQVNNFTELKTFARRVGFPLHALLLKDRETNFTQCFKGIFTEEALQNAFTSLGHTAWAETDMRAMHNPTRMKAIEAAAHKLAAKVLSRCPNCHEPGFAVTAAIEGLPCELCNQPTRGILFHIYTCTSCTHREERIPPQRKAFQDAMYCDYCNP
ncbi:MAG: hypothetical protein IM638_00570 [Bacteroidetes bacterium]|nr:hypothetical protein [Bacteroidota bacterium]